jgi:hypothetical protein
MAATASLASAVRATSAFENWANRSAGSVIGHSYRFQIGTDWAVPQPRTISRTAGGTPVIYPGEIMVDGIATLALTRRGAMPLQLNIKSPTLAFLSPAKLE